ncbi:MAG: class I SAM-dependent DNA methyltransferase, partial [Pyrinomonadaceae bacterium]
MADSSEFDRYAEDYQLHVNEALAVSGEDSGYFARRRVAWLSRYLRQTKEPIRTVIDYGCGTGTLTPHLFELLSVDSVLGVDVSPKSLDVARREHSSNRAQFLLFEQHQPSAQSDLAVCCNVFHHIPPGERASAVDYIYRSLRPGGLLSFWEQNPWNPGTRYIMSRCAFDRDAITLTPPEARR